MKHSSLLVERGRITRRCLCCIGHRESPVRGGRAQARQTNSTDSLWRPSCQPDIDGTAQERDECLSGFRQLAELDTAHLIATSSAAREIAGSACRKSFGSGYEGFELTFFIARAFD
jgi:hypothetical protein